MTEISFKVLAVPVAQPRQRTRVMQIGGKAIAQNYTPADSPVNAFKASVRLALREAYQGAPIEGPIRMDVVFVMPRPASKTRKRGPNDRLWHTAKPDRDNLAKSLQDALEGLLFCNDSQICAGEVRKVVAAGDEQPHVEVRVKQL